MDHIPAFFFDAETLEQRLSDNGGRAQFLNAIPFPHMVLDDFLPEEILQRLIAEFPGQDDIEWIPWGPGRTLGAAAKLNKLGQSDERCFPPFLRHFMNQLLSDTFVKFVEAASGIQGIIVDPSHHGCGLHSTGRHGRLMIHTDVNRHPHSNRRIHQVLNLIIYLNNDWKEEYKGHLELWTADRKPCKRILPIANRAVLFETGTRSFHGHPEPLACPEGRRRNSLAVYYYSLDRPTSQAYDGMQRHARWIPTTQEDRSRAILAAGQAESVSLQMSGRVARLPAELLPIFVAGMSEHDDAYLRMIHETALPTESRTALREGRLAAMLAHDIENLDRYYLLGFVAASKDARLNDGNSLLLVCSRDDGAIYIEQPKTGTALFWGYFDKLERILVNGGG